MLKQLNVGVVLHRKHRFVCVLFVHTIQCVVELALQLYNPQVRALEYLRWGFARSDRPPRSIVLGRRLDRQEVTMPQSWNR